MLFVIGNNAIHISCDKINIIYLYDLKQYSISKLSLHIDTQMDISALEIYVIESDARSDSRYSWNRNAYRSRILP